MDVGVARDEDDGNLRVHAVEPLLQLWAGELGHAHVKKHDAGPSRIEVPKKVGARGVGGRSEALALEHEAERLADLVLVVDNSDERFVMRVLHEASPGA